jgi:methionyl-tRNA formyltransferase
VARLAYLGSPEAAVVPLEALVDAGHDVALVVSRRDARRGRGSTPGPSPVKRAALELGLKVSDRLDDVVGADVELGVVVAYGRIVPARVLAGLDMVNLHFSVLPRWRGAAPVERAILAGDTETGVSVMRLEEGLDTGPVLAVERVAIAPDEHASALSARLASVGARLLVELLRDGVDALPVGDPQVGEPTYAAKLEPDELRLDWARPAVELERVVRLDRAWTTFRGARLRVLEATARPRGAPGSPDDVGRLDGTAVRTGVGVLELHVVQPAGRRPTPTSEWTRGARPAPDERLGGPEKAAR